MWSSIVEANAEPAGAVSSHVFVNAANPDAAARIAASVHAPIHPRHLLISDLLYTVPTPLPLEPRVASAGTETAPLSPPTSTQSTGSRHSPQCVAATSSTCPFRLTS